MGGGGGATPPAGPSAPPHPAASPAAGRRSPVGTPGGEQTVHRPSQAQELAFILHCKKNASPHPRGILGVGSAEFPGQHTLQIVFATFQNKTINFTSLDCLCCAPFQSDSTSFVPNFAMLSVQSNLSVPSLSRALFRLSLAFCISHF